jgi:tRNA threonylcarbamoyladenosine biosynthesis protein TsaB
MIENGKAMSERSVEAHYVHSEKLMVLIDEVLTSQGLNPKTIDGIAVSVGPGSFTGLRIGLSTAKGISYAVKKPLVAVSTLEALAKNAIYKQITQQNDCVLAIIDARRNELYASAFTVDDKKLIEYIAVRALTVDELRNCLPRDRRIIVLGDGTEKFQHFLNEQPVAGNKRFVFPARELRQCTAFSVGSLGEEKLLRGEHAEIASLEPFYVKEFYTTMQV